MKESKDISVSELVERTTKPWIVLCLTTPSGRNTLCWETSKIKLLHSLERLDLETTMATPFVRKMIELGLAIIFEVEDWDTISELICYPHECTERSTHNENDKR